MIEFLKDWQDLTGALIGGISGLFVALLVGHIAIQEQRRSSAMLMLVDLLAIKASIQRIEEIGIEKKVPEKDFPIYVVHQIMFMRPTLATMYEVSMINILTSDKYLAAHATLGLSIFRDVETVIDRIAEDVKLKQAKKHINRSENEFNSDAAIIWNGLKRTKGQAEATAYYLEKIVLNKFSMFYKIRRKFFKNDQERKFFNMLKTGES